MGASTIQRDLMNWLRAQSRNLVMGNVYVKGSLWEADVITVTHAYFWTEYEIKISLSDYRRDFTKSEWHGKGRKKHDLYSGNDEIRRHGKIIPKPKEFYFVVSEGLLGAVEVPKHCGILEHANGAIRQTRPAPRLKQATKLDQAAIFNLALKLSGNHAEVRL